MTRKQHLQKLLLQKRLQAMENIRRYGFGLLGLFAFCNSKQWADYWGIELKYFG